MLGQKRIPTLLFLLGTLIPQIGCVALNIPSQRLHDPADHGGLFGHWRNVEDPNAGHHVSHELHHSGGFCIDGGPLEVDPLDPSLDFNGNPKQPEVPWPRFHPVPTRPVFGISDL